MIESTKDKLIKTTADVIQSKGYFGTGINKILEITKVPKGSLYHHFPKGKDDLICEAIKYSGKVELEKYSTLASGKNSAEEVFIAIIDNLVDQLLNSNFEKGCPIATVALEVSTNNEKIRTVCSDVFNLMQGRLAAFLRLANESNAHQKAKTFLTFLEGAYILTKVHKNVAHLENMKEQIKIILL